MKIMHEIPKSLKPIGNKNDIKIKDVKMAHNCHKCETCELCNNKFKNKANLKRHINDEHGLSITDDISDPEAIIYDCHECEKFSPIQQRETSDDLPSLEYDKENRLIKDSMCELCNKKFKNRANLKKHIKYEHDISFTDEILDCMISNCQECGKFSSIQQCENTLKTHIKQEPPDDLKEHEDLTKKNPVSSNQSKIQKYYKHLCLSTFH